EAARLELRRESSFGSLPEIALQRGLDRKRIYEIRIEAKAGLGTRIEPKPLVIQGYSLPEQAQDSFDDRLAQPNAPGVDVNETLAINRSVSVENAFGSLMEEGCDLAVAVGNEHAVLGAFIHPRLH